jgi:hypothetical protein
LAGCALKCQFGYCKAHYHDIAMNGAQVFALLTFANLYLVRGRLVPARGELPA